MREAQQAQLMLCNVTPFFLLLLSVLCRFMGTYIISNKWLLNAILTIFFQNFIFMLYSVFSRNKVDNLVLSQSRAILDYFALAHEHDPFKEFMLHL